MENNRFFVLESVLSEAVNDRCSCDLVAVSNAFFYDFDCGPESCDLVVAKSRRINHALDGAYVVPFVVGGQKSNVFAGIARERILRPSLSRFIGLSGDEPKPFLYDAHGDAIKPGEYLVTDLGRIRARLTNPEIERISFFAHKDYY